MPIDSSLVWEFDFRFRTESCPNTTTSEGLVDYVFSSSHGASDSTVYVLNGEFTGQKTFCCDSNNEKTVQDISFVDRFEISKTDSSMYFVFSPNGHIIGPVPRYVETERDSVHERRGHEVRDARWGVGIVEGIGLRFLSGSFDPSICFYEGYSLLATDYIPSPW